jgi:hypothetical protein
VGVGQTHVVKDWALTLVHRDLHYSDKEGCVITDATFVTMPAGTTVDGDALGRLDHWLGERKSGAYHVKTEWDTPKMVVHFADANERRRLLTDYFLAREFAPRFDRVSEDVVRNQEVWAYNDTRLLQTRMGRKAMDKLRAAREAFQQSGLPVTAEIAGGSAMLTLTFPDAAARAEFDRRLAATKIPEDVLVVLDEPEEGALAVVDRKTGQVLVPESRFYPSKGQTTTEVAITNGDFLVDVYVAMQPDMGDKPYVKVFTVIFPLVNFLWIGGLLLLIGSAIALTPRWLGRTLALMVAGGRGDADRDDAGEPARPVPALARVGGTAVLVVGIVLGAMLVSSSARAQALPEPYGFAPPVGDPARDLMARLDCACPLPSGQVTHPPLADAACACPQAAAARAVVADVLGRHAPAEVKSGRAKYDAFTELIELDPQWETRIRYDQATLTRLMQTTRTVCPGEYLMTLDQSRATCTFRMRWIATFRRLLAAGVSLDDAFGYYLAESNATMARDRPWAAHELRTFEDDVMSLWVPIGIGVGVIALLLVIIVPRVRRARAAHTTLVPAGPSLSAADRELLRDEHDALES